MCDHCVCAPSCSRASDIKSPRDPFALAVDVRSTSASHAPCRHFLFLSLVGLFFFPPLTSALTFGDFSQLFLSPFFFLFSFFLFSIYFFFFSCPPSSVIIMPIPCFVLLFLFGDFYGDSALPRNNESLGGLRSANSHDFFINR